MKLKNGYDQKWSTTPNKYNFMNMCTFKNNIESNKFKMKEKLLIYLNLIHINSFLKLSDFLLIVWWEKVTTI